MEPVPVDLGIPGLTGARELGRGGFGSVYAVQEPEFGRSVAVKVLRQRLDDAAVRRAFARECQAMGALSGHPHIVTVHRGGTTGHGQPYIVMDLMSGGSLADRAATPWPEVLETGILLGGALETAHRHGILHLDLKPANVLVSRYGEPKLADFGIARLPGIAETSGDIRLSPAYAAPERLAEGASTVRTDLYGFGATLFTLLTGSSAFGRDTPEELLVMLARIVREPVPDLRTRGVHDAVCRVVERLMAKEPAERYASAADAVAALQDAQRATGQPVTRAVVEGAATAAQESAAPTDLALEPAPLTARSSSTAQWPPAVRPGAVAPWPTSARPVPAAQPPTATPRPAAVHRAPSPPWPSTAAGPAPAPRPWAGAAPPAPPAPAKRSRRGPLIGIVAVVLVAAVGVGTAVLSGGTGGAITPTTDPVPTSSATTAPPVGSVVVAPGVSGAGVPAALATMDAYVSSINAERYADTFALFSSDSRTAQNGLQAWLDVQRPRTISDARITSVTADATVVMTFTSRQAPADGPGGDQDCTEWEQSYTLTGPDRLIRSSETLTSRACA
ncbi:serine/threonine-protein kinase [Pseudonocardia abyssalis]|uniref:non-specific serine/threonine protein kinase n=1 Tax=Pseudonocardia abyssalis TaxID=2792008 RepID=A0ABS6USK3_9PSEU|nr:serine/threonine-protein kinase [Pseudonocardia abyssalis]MBW0116839.1 protein kinase [Pseudonocardia abyssalis]MBW0135244.1 protein kinase [Pseudonocardia abyssalis]